MYLDHSVIDQTFVQKSVPAYIRANVKFDPSTRALRNVFDGINLTTSNQEVHLLPLALFHLIGTGVASLEKQKRVIPALYIGVGTGEGTIVEDSWKQSPTISMYRSILEDYDVAAIEEAHMRAAKKYGW